MIKSVCFFNVPFIYSPSVLTMFAIIIYLYFLIEQESHYQFHFSVILSKAFILCKEFLAPLQRNAAVSIFQVKRYFLEDDVHSSLLFLNISIYLLLG